MRHLRNISQLTGIMAGAVGVFSALDLLWLPALGFAVLASVLLTVAMVAEMAG